jgi:hypothetical protein
MHDRVHRRLVIDSDVVAYSLGVAGVSDVIHMTLGTLDPDNVSTKCQILTFSLATHLFTASPLITRPECHEGD